MTTDTESPSGSWEREWDARPHSTDELRKEIASLRERIRSYVGEIEELKANASRGSGEAEGRQEGCQNCKDFWEALKLLSARGSQAATEMLQTLESGGTGSTPAVESITITLNEREGDYGLFGDFSDKAEFSQKLKDMINDSFGWTEFASPTEKESMHMIIHKISRIVHGNPSHVDSWRDIAGYAMLAVNYLDAEKGAPR